MLRKNVSISDTHLKMLDPLLKKHQGNLSAAMRDIIDFTGFVTENMGSLETAKDLFKEKNHAMEQTRNRIYGITIPLTMFRWLLSNRKSSLPPINEAIQLFSQQNINSYDINTLNKVINEEISFLNWPISVNIGSENGQISIQITGIDPEINSFYAKLITMYLSNNKSPQKISKLLNYPASIYMLFGSASTQEEALKSMYEAFGENGRDKISGENDMVLIASS
ncbi:MAG: hypothetical protein MPEBLZ_02835 [Candidatus Methanoperedens nitroreducens]|uniref:Uncharacterized protein n=1 Tax=Candidatus Methanoperedens nitratireducens TaxID=1392998 RepID=A0A0P8CIG6_9EURY|nr:hypothetical protein [Candidatus Methanoperedens sp. BLZ2]KAB2942443.1 MAG: hypothetical protein F9K14_17050 [Candidatus Methanoperedens sp.]KPQ42624.1 MAG: hypothetical protein MPEBLZ_02835 [Candidatus Methanoperedens sp. BLZ1]MBZ0177127.1 hypothetical protein [Candidatus Methanoperedens nitroreducens]MCX9077558.1 hypothetical protein [Candidatus Methanoperedens sp.]MCX9089371.1 hypothetical protein [Candidatus Methanoperedens sp.]